MIHFAHIFFFLIIIHRILEKFFFKKYDSILYRYGITAKRVKIAPIAQGPNTLEKTRDSLTEKNYHASIIGNILLFYDPKKENRIYGIFWFLCEIAEDDKLQITIKSSFFNFGLFMLPVLFYLDVFINTGISRFLDWRFLSLQLFFIPFFFFIPYFLYKSWIQVQQEEIEKLLSNY